MNYRLHKDRSGRRQIQVQVYRDNRATAGLRRGMKMRDWTGVLTAIKRKLGRKHVPVLITIRERTRYTTRKRRAKKK
jgi:hypothetical protein